MDPCAARSARTLFNKHEIVQGSHPDFAVRAEFFGARHAHASNTRRCVCEVEGESPELVRIFAARASVRVSLAAKFADVAQLAERDVADVEGVGSSPIVRSRF
jgi:hypothetical protein